MFTLLLFLVIIGVGTMMAILYKGTTTTANLLNPDPKISLRVFILSFVIAMLTTYGLSWYATYSIYKSDLPEEGNINYQNLKTLTFFIINISYFLMMLFANAYAQSLKKIAAAPYLLTLSFYIAFILRDAYVVTPYYIEWAQNAELMLNNELSNYAETARYKCIIATFTTAYNAAAIWWSLRK